MAVKTAVYTWTPGTAKIAPTSQVGKARRLIADDLRIDGKPVPSGRVMLTNAQWEAWFDMGPKPALAALHGGEVVLPIVTRGRPAAAAIDEADLF